MNKLISKYLFYYPITIIRGELIGKYLSQYSSMQWKSQDEIIAYQNESLRKLLLHAYKTVPYYHRLIDESGINLKSTASIEQLSLLPITTKQDIAVFADELRSTKHQLFYSNKTTGGSTGEVVTITKNADALARERAATWRAYYWAGITIGDIQARFWGTPLTNKGRLLYRAVDYISNRVRLSAFNLTNNALKEYYNRLSKLRPAYLYGYVSMIVDFAKYIKANDHKPIPDLKCIITTSEVLDAASRKLIETAFNVKVFNEYGCGEVGSIAHECEQGSMHIMAENVIIEIDTGNDPEASSGRIIVTDLHNYAMPLIRYDIGDYATLSDKPCICGRGLPVIKKIHGRAYDIIVDPTGNRHHPEILMYIFEALKADNANIRQFQVVQTAVDQLHIIIVADDGYDIKTERDIAESIARDIHPEIRINITYADTIAREKSGKLRVIKSLIHT